MVSRHTPTTPRQAWPRLSARGGYGVWVKHENHTPIGAFKLRGGLVYMDALTPDRPEVTGVIAATRGNHGQSIAYAAARRCTSAARSTPEPGAADRRAVE